MITTIYIDVLFFSNLIINFILLYATGFCVNRKSVFFRNFTSAAVGAIYLCVMFFSKYTLLESFGFKLIVSVAMILISWNLRKAAEFFKTLGVYYILNFVLAGGIIFANSILNICLLTNGAVYFKTTFFSMAVGVIIVVVFGGGFFYIVKKSILSQENEKELTLFYCDNEIKLRAFADTGNSLVDPLSHASVVVVSENKLSHIIGDRPIEEIKNFRIIPCSTITDKCGTLRGFKPDKLIYREKELNAVIAMSEALVNSDYDAIINPLTLI